MKVKVKKVSAGRYEGGGLVVMKQCLFGESWQVRRMKDSKLLGEYGSLAEALFHHELEIMAGKKAV